MVKKISVIGAGAVGATLAQRIIEKGIADVALIDIAKNIAVGKALDLMDAAAIVGHEKKITGTDDYSAIADSSIVVITAGLPRKPGMTREELVAKNAAIVRDVSSKIKHHAPGSIVIVVTNPLDAMTYLALKTTGFKRERVFGMAGVLDGSRLIALIAEELKVPRSEVKTLVLGSHGDTMVSVISNTTVNGKSVSSLMSKDKLEAIVKRTCDRGAEIVNLLGTGSAFYSPSASTVHMIEAIAGDTGQTMAASAYLSGEYGLDDICIGVPCSIGKDGIRKIMTIDLSPEEKALFQRSAKAIKETVKLL
jgi:malate dehydrogenase